MISNIRNELCLDRAATFLNITPFRAGRGADLRFTEQASTHITPALNLWGMNGQSQAQSRDHK
jgi:hypothetical protein